MLLPRAFSLIGSVLPPYSWCLQLFAEDSPDTDLAYIKDEPPIFALMIQREWYDAQESLDEVLLSFIILEQNLRGTSNNF